MMTAGTYTMTFTWPCLWQVSAIINLREGRRFVFIAVDEDFNPVSVSAQRYTALIRWSSSELSESAMSDLVAVWSHFDSMLIYQLLRLDWLVHCHITRQHAPFIASFMLRETSLCRRLGRVLYQSSSCHWNRLYAGTFPNSVSSMGK